MKTKNHDELWEFCKALFSISRGLCSVVQSIRTFISYLSHCRDEWMRSSKPMQVIQDVLFPRHHDFMHLIVACLSIQNKAYI